MYVVVMWTQIWRKKRYHMTLLAPSPIECGTCIPPLSYCTWFGFCKDPCRFIITLGLGDTPASVLARLGLCSQISERVAL